MPAQGIDLVLLVSVLAMVGFGLLMVYSSSYIYAAERTGNGYAFVTKQLIFAVLGVGALVVGTRIPYRKWADWAYPSLGVAVVMLAAVLIPGIGARVGGAQRWLRLGPLNFQPSELAKFAVIFFVARQLEKKSDRLKQLVPGLISHYLVPLPVFLLLLAQPDFGTTMMISMVIFLMLFIAGTAKRWLAGAVVFGGAIATALAMGTAYRRDRVMTFLDPFRDPQGKGFQVIQSLVGLNNGGITGVGLGNSKEKLFFLPEAHNDFIFAIIGEELGFMGVVGVVLAFVFFIYRGLKIAFDAQDKHNDRFGMLLATGITLALGVQGFVNMAVAFGLLPTKGLTLPFISYGGSALLIDMFAVGVLLAVARGPQQGHAPAHGKRK